ncbi:MAG: rhomboid family intramembrane serine protease [Bacteriovoracaceae bacterium]
MNKRLTKTFLSKKPGDWNIFTGVFSFLVLLAIFLFSGRNFEASGVLVFDKGEWWRAFTTSLMHADFVHLGHNALFFTVFAVLLNTYFGWFMFPLMSFVMGGVINLLTLSFYPREVTLVGISGVIYFMASFWMTSFVLIERNRKLRHRLITVAGISLALFCPDVTHLEARVSYLSHALGFALGIPAAMVWFWWNKEEVRMSEVWTERAKADFEWQEAIDLLPPEYFENLPEEPLHRH